jgi:hypothetical protein
MERSYWSGSVFAAVRELEEAGSTASSSGGHRSAPSINANLPAQRRPEKQLRIHERSRPVTLLPFP